MRRAMTNRLRGFSLVELTVSMAIGLIVMGAALQVFLNGTNAAREATMRSEMQDNLRGALNLIAKDVSMAGAGLPSGGFQLPAGGGSPGPSLIGCPQVGPCYIAASTYPGAPPFMLGLVPQFANGMQVGSASATLPANPGVVPDGITVAYEDYSFPLRQYTITFPDATGTSITVTPPAAPPPGFPAIQSPNGIQVGDLIMLITTSGGGAYAVGEVTGIAAGGGTIFFADGDPLRINQSTAATGNIASVIGPCPGAPCPLGGTIATRILVVTYFIQNLAGQQPRLMRQVNGQTAVPVTDDIIGIRFTYDACTATVVPPCAALPSPLTNVPPYSPYQLSKANIQLMGQSMTTNLGKSVSGALSTSVSLRNMAYKDLYP